MTSKPVELWSPVNGFDMYLVSNYGRIYSEYSQKFLKHRVRKNGYSHICLKTTDPDGKKKATCRSVAHLVAEHFLEEEYRKGVQVLHIDGDKSNNYVENLYFEDWTLRDPRPSKKVDYSKAIRTPRRARIVEWEQEFDSVREMCDSFGGTLTSVYAVLNGKAKHHLGLTFEYID